MARSHVFISCVLMALGSPRAAAQEGLEFTLAEVDQANTEGEQERALPAKQAADPKLAIEQALGPLRWGMSKSDVIKLLTARIRAELEQRIKVERDIMRQDALYQESAERARRLAESFVSFDGPKNGWDVSPIAGEFTRGNKEAMLVITGKGTRDMYFFIQGKLWKWYRELSPEADATEVLQTLRQRFGKGTRQQERRDESNTLYEGTTWTDDTTRVTALQRGGDSVLIFEDVRTLEKLATLRYNVQGRGSKASASSVVDLILLTDAERKERGQ